MSCIRLPALQHLIREGGPGWHAYVLRQAESLQQNGSDCAGIVAMIEAEIGPEATARARRAAKWMESV